MRPTWNPNTRTMDYTTANGLKFSVKATKKEVSRALLGDYHQVYNIWVIRGEEKRRFTFHDSIQNYNYGRGVTPGMLNNALDSIISDCYAAVNCPAFWEFANEFGYGDEDMAAARMAFNGCHNNLRKMQDLFSMENIEDINQTQYSGEWDSLCDLDK